MRFTSLRRPLGGFMPPVEGEEKRSAEAESARLLKLIGLVFKRLKDLEKTMADQNYTTADILAAVKEQQGITASMSAMLTQIHGRVMQLVAGQVNPQTQADINEAFAEIKGNSRALADAITTYTPDAGAPAQPAGQTATSTTASLSKSTINVGDSVTISAGVSSATGNAAALTGSVDFLSDGQKIGSGSLDSTGVAAFSTTAAPAGDHSITAVYGGDSNYASSTSEPVVLSVMPAQSAGEAGSAAGSSQGSTTGAAAGDGSQQAGQQQGS
jgi:uncharacterized coiled-coil protein SlyX